MDIHKGEGEIKDWIFKGFINRNKWDGQLSITETHTSGQQPERQEALFEVGCLSLWFGGLWRGCLSDWKEATVEEA